MAEVKSLGVRTPVALPYLIREGVLPQHPDGESYQWETYVSRGERGDVEEEVLSTKRCVVWSQGRSIRNVYRFEDEGEDVIQAILTTFPGNGASFSDESKAAEPRRDNNDSRPSSKRTPPRSLDSLNEGNPDHKPLNSGTANRALVVFLKTKAHVYFLHGASYIVDLPIDVDRAFPAPCGVIVQRKASPSRSLPPTPLVPAVPPNSFLSTQTLPSSSYLQSPSVSKSFRSSQPARPSPLSGNKSLDSLFQDAFGNAFQPAEDDLAPVYSLVSPLSDFGVVTYSLQHQKPRLSAKVSPGLSVEFEPLDAAEEVVYVSPGDELVHGTGSAHGQLMLIVTANSDLRTLTVWHAWYVDERSLASLMKQRAAQKAAKARRRSSFLNASVGTGTATPAGRHREGTRESFAAAGSMRVPGESTSHANAASSRKPTRQEEEDAMASQMDPDYQPNGSQQNARESRRISSLNADVRASQNAATTSFAGPSGRRNASFGGPNERRSFGHRKSRGSTPGSVFSRSLGPEDDLMDVDSSMDDADGEESTDGILRHIRATFDATGPESIFGGPDGEFKRDLVVRKLHSFTMPSIATSPNRAASTIRIATLRDAVPLPEGEDERLNIYVHDNVTKKLVCLHLRARHRALWPGLEERLYVAIPFVTGETNLGQCRNIERLKDGNREAVLLADRGLILSLDEDITCAIPATPSRSNSVASLLQSGIEGSSNEVPDDGMFHRRKLKLQPDDPSIRRLLDVCRLLLPERQSQMISGMWCLAHATVTTRAAGSYPTVVSSEWIAFATIVFGFFAYLVDDSHESLNIGHNTDQHSAKLRVELQRQQQRDLLSRQASWRVSNVRPRIQDRFLQIAAGTASQLVQSGPWKTLSESLVLPLGALSELVLGFHVYNEEHKLCVLDRNCQQGNTLAVIIAQLGCILHLSPWDFSSGQYYNLNGACEENWAFVKPATPSLPPCMPLMEEPVGVFHWFEHVLKTHSAERYPTLDVIAGLNRTSPLSAPFKQVAVQLTPRITALSNLIEATSGLTTDAVTTIQLMAKYGITGDVMSILPIAIAAPFREAAACCEREPPTTWSADLLSLVGRDDLNIDPKRRNQSTSKTTANLANPPRDFQTICNVLDHYPQSARTKEASRHAVSQLIFNEDRRLVEATSLMHFNTVQVAECSKPPDWSDAYHLEQQRRLMQWVTIRMIALPAGDAMVHFDSQMPLLTDKYHLPGFSNFCLMQPMGHTLTTDRSGLTEEKVNWAYFHAGVSAGLHISRNVQGIDTSWIAFNKPNELTNRHAGLLLALGLNGHLRHLAKWLSFKYLTPKHTMTSVGLLLGLSASYMGTMDGLITRVLSVHITRMLPPGAAELNVSPITQTAGLMGIGLLYYNTQHRRMSEVMLSEIEHMELEDPDSGPDPLRDESYRLAAGFALGLINLGKGKDLRGLHGMSLPERLLAIAVGPRPVSAVHVFDRATAGAVIAVALVYMKSGDKAIARKIDIPDTEAQFDHVRSDILMLRAMAKHLILWDSMDITEASPDVPLWTTANLPPCYKSRFQQMHASARWHSLKTSDIPFFNIISGLVWALSLKYAGTGNVLARDEALQVLDLFYLVQSGGTSAPSFNYDAKLTRSTVRRCIDVLALSAATIMAGTGDLKTFRYLRRLHGRINPDTPYGSHMAAHLAIGVLFLGGGTYTFGTSDLAIAGLLCAFHPLYPNDVHDNHVHLQAFRHFWVFAAEARCLVVEDADTQRPISMPITVNLKDGSTKSLTSPCLLPELDTIGTVQTSDEAYWRVTLDFASNSQHLTSFKENQHILVRRCPSSEAHVSVFSATLSALSETPQATTNQKWHSIFSLPVFKDFDKADLELILPPDLHSSIYLDDRGTVIDERLELAKSVSSTERDELWNLRVLFAWAEKVKDDGEGRLKWVGNEIVESLRAKIQERERIANTRGQAEVQS